MAPWPGEKGVVPGASSTPQTCGASTAGQAVLKLNPQAPRPAPPTNTHKGRAPTVPGATGTQTRATPGSFP